MARREAKQVYEDAWLALLLAWIAGNVDAIGFLTLSHLFTAHMSGNMAAMGAELGVGRWAEAWHRALPIPLFVTGVATGVGLVEIAMRRRSRSPFATVLGVQALLLSVFLIWGDLRLRNGVIRTVGEWEYCLLVALPSLAMGLQNSLFHKVGNQNVRTTYVSGMLTNFAEQGVAFLFWLNEHLWGSSLVRRRRAWRIARRHPALHHTLLFSGICCAFLCGAVMGGVAIQRWALKALLLPLTGVGIVMIVNWLHPIASRQGASYLAPAVILPIDSGNPDKKDKSGIGGR